MGGGLCLRRFWILPQRLLLGVPSPLCKVSFLLLQVPPPPAHLRAGKGCCVSVGGVILVPAASYLVGGGAEMHIPLPCVASGARGRTPTPQPPAPAAGPRVPTGEGGWLTGGWGWACPRKLNWLVFYTQAGEGRVHQSQVRGAAVCVPR